MVIVNYRFSKLSKCQKLNQKSLSSSENFKLFAADTFFEASICLCLELTILNSLLKLIQAQLSLFVVDWKRDVNRRDQEVRHLFKLPIFWNGRSAFTASRIVLFHSLPSNTRSVKLVTALVHDERLHLGSLAPRTALVIWEADVH